MTMAKAKWRPIVGCSNYAVSSHGKVKRLKHRSVGKLYRILDEMIIEPQMNRQGVVYANVRDDSGKKMTVGIQRLVIQTFGQPGVTYYRINPDLFDNRFDHFVREDIYPRMTDKPVIIKKIKVK
jgi:hypothetical protein